MFTFKNTYMAIVLGIGSSMGFLCTYLMDVAMGNAEQYLAVVSVLLLDGFFGIIAGARREGFKTYLRGN